jgi:Flp pilus assembly pilin Flp
MKKMAIKLMTAIQSRQRWNDEGAVSAEYGVLLAGVVAVVAVAATALGGRVSDIFDAVLP